MKYTTTDTNKMIISTSAAWPPLWSFPRPPPKISE